MLEASGALVYVNEPLNPQHPPGRSPGVLRADVTHAFQYISEENERVWLPAFRDTVQLRFHPLAEVRRNHRPYDLLRAVKYTAGFGLGRLRGAGPCSTTPTRCSRPRGWLAGSAAGWWSRSATRWPRCRAGAGSAGRRGWPSCWPSRRWSATAWAGSPRAGGGPGRRRRNGQADGVGQASLLWRVIYGTVAAYRREIDGLEVVRHEDLSADPVPAFQTLYARLGLPFGPGAERAVLAATSAGSGGADATGIRRPWAARPRPRPEGPRSGAMRWSLAGRGCPRRPPAASTAGPTSRCGASASPRGGGPHPRGHRRRRRPVRLHLGERQLVGPASSCAPPSHGQHSITNLLFALSTRTRP